MWPCRLEEGPAGWNMGGGGRERVTFLERRQLLEALKRQSTTGMLLYALFPHVILPGGGN